ncbi:polysaccharide deacetylase family protein [Edaphobacillus lindanitolerans]|uniref:Peptidoglycan/xylan/chitin deacetylase, PgdA/CDA1 family n=1 Tax=Edaphobacillus lindanitolerans TaxID=550447 RepID=A0A1U7PPL2_9BACI|nr:polysaccharide deacetylase family protein [Edaphobacillus lindanitolerans]SIT88642.1 Peptidoglycan/xylan/chitin deacetylase, PgdA/CDA1 family [Edaphobacillus lindanitolerans]
MLRRKVKWLHIPLWVLLVGLSTAGLLVLSLAIPSLTGKEEQSGQATAVVTEQKGVLPGLDLRTTVKDTDTYTSAISELSSDSETVNAPIREWIDGQTRTFKEELKENGSKQGEEMRAHLNIGLDTKQAGDSLFSLVFTSYRFTGGANGQTEVMPFTVDMNEKRIVPLGELFDLEGGLDAAELGRLVKEAIEAQDGLMDQVSDEALEAALADPSSWKWSLGDGSFTVYFDEYEVAAGSAGIVQAELPYDQVSLLMNPEASARIGVAKPSGTIDGDVRGTGEPEPLDPDGKYVALTFDDGPHPQVTPRVLETLEREDVKATFFMLGSQAEFYPDVARQVAEAGHEIGNHSDSHPDLTKFGIDGIRRQMVGSARKIEAATGVRPDVERPPYGAINDAVKQAASESGTPIVLWSVDSLDWKSRNAGAVNRLVSGRVHPGAIILMHDIHASTADALPQMIAELKAKGYQFVTVRQLAGLTADSGIGPYFNQ